MNKFKFDKELWFELEEDHCEGKHYLVYNPHTFIGRIGAYCPQKDLFFNVSFNEISNMSKETKYWLKGYLKGSEPAPPVDEDGDTYPETHEKFIHWEKSIELFYKTGCWYDGDRECELCGKSLLNSWTEVDCEECFK